MVTGTERLRRVCLDPPPALPMIGGLRPLIVMKHLILLAMLPAAVSLSSCAAVGGGDVRTETVTYTAGGATCTGYIAWDASKPGRRPGVLVVHEWWGHNEYVRRRARMLAEMGYTAMALDMYGDGKVAAHPDDAGKFMNEVLANMDVGKERFVAAQRVLAGHPSTDPAHLAAIGYCFGGAVVLAMARQGMPLDAVASFHGSLATKTPAKPGAVKARVLVCHGADDKFVSMQDVAALQQEMRAAGADCEVVVYPGAVHGFTSVEADENGKKFNLPLAYNKAADEASWAKLRTFLQQSFK
jgi:dienelactone hydrolase